MLYSPCTEYLKEPGLRILDSDNTYDRLYINAFINQTYKLKKVMSKFLRFISHKSM